MKNKGTAYHQLNKFAGKWNTEGLMISTGKKPGIEIKGTDTYEWLPGGFFLLHKVDVLMGDDRNQTLEIIGFDDVHNHYTMQYYDYKGNSGFMTATVVDGLWTFTGGNLRFKGRFNNQEDEFTGTWEQSADRENWTHLMDIKLKKAND